jgi:NADPH:quinone reductase-like Zn-dependent oxidoreductase
MDTLKTLGADAVMDRNDAIPKDTFDIVLDLRTLYLKDLTLIGSTRQDPRVFTNLVGYIEAGEIRPVVAETYPLQDLRAAQGAFLEKSHMGKIGIAVSN